MRLPQRIKYWRENQETFPFWGAKYEANFVYANLRRKQRVIDAALSRAERRQLMPKPRLRECDRMFSKKFIQEIKETPVKTLNVDSVLKKSDSNILQSMLLKMSDLSQSDRIQLTKSIRATFLKHSEAGSPRQITGFTEAR